jgi:hypothetical protein
VILVSTTGIKAKRTTTHREGQVRAGRRRGEFLPLRNITRRNRLRGSQQESYTQVETHAIVRTLGCITQERLDLSHGPDADDALDGKVRLVR